MPGPFPSGGYSTSGVLVKGLDKGGMNFVPHLDSLAEPDPMQTVFYSEVPEPDEIKALVPELDRATEFAHNVHDFTEAVTDDLKGSTEIHGALKEASIETHQPEPVSHQPELRSADGHLGETRVADTVVTETWHPTPDVTGVLLGAVAAAAAVHALHTIFKRDDPTYSPDEPAPEPGPEPEAKLDPAVASADLNTSTSASTLPTPLSALSPEQAAAARIEVGSQVSIEPVEDTEQSTPEASADTQTAAEKISEADKSVNAKSGAEAQQKTVAEANNPVENSPLKELDKPAEMASPTPSLSPSFGSF